MFVCMACWYKAEAAAAANNQCVLVNEMFNEGSTVFLGALSRIYYYLCKGSKCGVITAAHSHPTCHRIWTGRLNKQQALLKAPNMMKNLC